MYSEALKVRTPQKYIESTQEPKGVMSFTGARDFRNTVGSEDLKNKLDFIRLRRKMSFLIQETKQSQDLGLL